MLTVEEAQARILAEGVPLPREDVALADALGRVLAADLVAPVAVPPFTNSSMDGYAVRASDIVGASEAAPVPLRLIGQVPAGGVFTGEVMAGTTVRIFTGAPLPTGADAVVQQELTTPG
ncbi:MAG: molybdopterin molybdenumtransferase MoeA, partial [Ktedonobacterales bacterium]|nr:molybdopterin molybdenumtransferase MoeA [Ktedonobacterales bacterium]